MVNLSSISAEVRFEFSHLLPCFLFQPLIAVVLGCMGTTKIYLSNIDCGLFPRRTGP